MLFPLLAIPPLTASAIGVKTTSYIYPASIRVSIVFSVHASILLLSKSDIYAPGTEMTLEFGVLIPATEYG
jgi:hypothetical protein